MKQSPSSEANINLADQQIPRILWNPKVYYRVYKSSPLDPILSQMNSVHTFSHYFPNILSILFSHQRL